MDDVQMDSVQPSTAPETHRLDCAYVDADSGASDESDHEPTKEPKRAGRKRELSKSEPKNAEPKKPASKKAKRSHSEQRQFDNCRDIRQAVTRNVPSLRTQRKHLDENGMPLSVVAVRRQMTSDVLPNHQKQYFQSKDYSEDGRETFEKVRMMFINNLKAKEYFDHKVYTDLVNKEEIQSEEANRRRLEGDYEDGESSADAGVDEGCPGKTAADLSEGSGSESEYENSELPGLEHRRMHRGIYKPEQMKEGMKEAIKEAIRTPPRYLYRASSGLGRKSTNGYDSITLHLPAAHVNEDESCHASMYEIPNGLSEFSEMLGRRFLWHDRRKDEMLSWTSSLLFALVHATGRLAKGQGEIVIHVIDTANVTTMDGKPVDFHFAPDLLRLLDIKGWHGWEPFERHNLQRPWYTHEWLTHNVVMSPLKHSWEANIEELIDSGLYSFLPHLRLVDEDDMRSLYHRCGYTRSKYHRKDAATTSVTWDHFTLAKRLSRCFVSDSAKEADPYCIPPLNLVIDFLAIEARRKRDEGFMSWIRSNYTASDLTYIDYPRCIRVANNLPEDAQALDLSRDACFALGLPETPGTRVWMADENFDWYGKWLKNAESEIKIRLRRNELKESLFAKQMKRATEAAEEKMEKAELEKKSREPVLEKGGQTNKAEGMQSAESVESARDGRVTDGCDSRVALEGEDIRMQVAVAASIEPSLLAADGSPQRDAQASGQMAVSEDRPSKAIERAKDGDKF